MTAVANRNNVTGAWFGLVDQSAVAGFVQLAAGGHWDRAVRFALEETGGTSGDKLGPERPAVGGKRLALEIFFGDSLEAAFVGVRPAAEPLAAANKVLADLRSTETPRNVSAAVGVLRDHIDPTLFTARPVSAAIGLVNEWEATAQELWRGGAVPTVDELLRSQHPLLSGARTWMKPFALELVFPGPPEHWLGLPVSEPADGGYRLDHRRLAMCLRAVEDHR